MAGEEEFNAYDSFDIGLGMAYTVFNSPRCGSLILGSGIYKNNRIDEFIWYLTPRLSFDFDNITVEFTSDISVPDLVLQKPWYSSLECGVFWKL